MPKSSPFIRAKGGNKMGAENLNAGFPDVTSNAGSVTPMTQLEPRPLSSDQQKAWELYNLPGFARQAKSIVRTEHPFEDATWRERRTAQGAHVMDLMRADRANRGDEGDRARFIGIHPENGDALLTKARRIREDLTERNSDVYAQAGDWTDDETNAVRSGAQAYVTGTLGRGFRQYMASQTDDLGIKYEKPRDRVKRNTGELVTTAVSFAAIDAPLYVLGWGTNALEHFYKFDVEHLPWQAQAAVGAVSVGLYGKEVVDNCREAVKSVAQRGVSLNMGATRGYNLARRWGWSDNPRIRSLFGLVGALVPHGGAEAAHAPEDIAAFSFGGGKSAALGTFSAEALAAIPLIRLQTHLSARMRNGQDWRDALADMAKTPLGKIGISVKQEVPGISRRSRNVLPENTLPGE